MMKRSYPVMALLCLTTLVGVQFYRPSEDPSLRTNIDISRNMLMEYHLADSTQKVGQDTKGRLCVVIVTTKRSGSTFLGEIFNQNKDMVYLFEPLRYLTMLGVKNNRVSVSFKKYARKVMKNVVNCKFSEMPLSLDFWARSYFCKYGRALHETNLCTNASITATEALVGLERICNKTNAIAMKTIRVDNISLLQQTIQNARENVKILHLVRDPRGVMSSRKLLNNQNVEYKRKKMLGYPLSEVEDLCTHMQRNVAYATDAPTWLRGRYMLVRFEDLATEPIRTVRAVYQFLELPFPIEVKDWLITHTTHTDNYAYGTTRNSSSVTTAWRFSMDNYTLLNIQNKCKPVMDLLGYNEIQPEEIENIDIQSTNALSANLRNYWEN